MNFKRTYLYTILPFILLIATEATTHARDVPKDCRDTTVHHTEKVAFLMVVNFNASTFRWRTGYRKWSTVEKIGNCSSIPKSPALPTPSYTYYFSNNKTQVKQDIVDFRVLKP